MVKTKKRQCDTKPVRSTTNAVLLKPSRKKNYRKKQIRNNYVQDKIRQSMKELGKAETVTGIETQNPVQLQNYDHCLPEGDEIPSVPKSILPKYEKRRLWRKCLKEARELQKAYLASAVSKAKGLASKSVGGKSTSKQSTKQVKTNKEHLGQKKKEVSNGKTIGKRQKSKKKVKRLQPSLNKQNVIKTKKVEQSLTQAFSLSKPKTNGFPLQNLVPDANNTNKVDISLPDADQSDSDYDPDYNSNADPNEDQISEIEMSFEGDAQQDTVQEVISDNDSELDPDYHPDQYTAQEVVFENESSSEDDPDYVPEQNTTQEVVFENESNSEDDPDYYLDQDTVQEKVFVNETGTKSDLDFDFVQKEVFANDSNSESDSDYSPEQDIDSENDHPSDYIPTTNGFEVSDLETEQPVGQYALVRRDEERNYEDEVEDDSDSDFSVGSDAEEIVFNEGWQQQQPFSSDEDSMASMSVSQMQDAYREFVENYMRDHENVQVHQAVNDEDDSSDDSCPELVPICPTDGVSAVDAALSESSFGTEYSCEHSDCCGYSEDGDGETDEEEEAEEEEDEEWQNVGESDDDVEIEESENSSGEAYSDLEVDDFSDYTEDVSEDNMDEEYGGAFSYVDNEQFENTEDESTFEDPHFFESDRPPLIISAGQSSKNSWSKFPLDLNQSVGSFGHDTTIENIVRQVRLNNPRPVEMSILNEENGETSDLDESETTVEETLNDEAEEQTSSAPEAFETIETLDNTVNEDDQNDQEAAVHQEYQNEYDDLETSTTSTANHNRPRFYNSLNSRQVLLVLKSELHFHGILKVTLLAGNARVYGFSLRTNQPVTAFSSRGHSFVSIQPMQPANAENATQKAAYLDTVQSILTSMESDFISHDIFSAIECFDPSNDVLLLLEPAARQLPGLNMIQKYMRQLVFPNVNSFNKRGAYYSSEFILRTKFFLLPRTKLHVNPQWSSVPLGATSRTLVLGGKGVGKSTFVRFAANSCVQRYGRVLLIDLDIGQPEIFVPQTISATLLADPLLGPGFLQNQKPDYALLFGEINVTVSPLKYLRCVLKLLQHCASNADYSNVPWIINTMGYNKGFGPELMAAVLRTFSGCTDVVQIQSQRQLDNFDQIMNFGVVNEYRFNFFHSELLAAEKLEPVKYQTHVVRSLARKFGDRTNDWDMSAKDTRFAIVLSHLGALLRDGGEWITDVKPMCASLDDLKVITSEEVSPDQYLRLLNGNLVYLCHQNPLDTSDAHVECLGIGIVRAVDQDTNKIYLLPALTNLAKLAATNALAVCTTPLPSSLITNHNRRVTGRVPYVYSTDDFIGSKQVVRISYRPVFTPQKV